MLRASSNWASRFAAEGAGDVVRVLAGGWPAREGWRVGVRSRTFWPCGMRKVSADMLIMALTWTRAAIAYQIMLPSLTGIRAAVSGPKK